MKTYIAWILRIAIALMFIGHGYFAIQGRMEWLSYLIAWGFSLKTAEILLPLIGWADQVVALFILIKPHQIIVMWAIFWTIATAISRPLAGEPFMEFIERGSNIGAPLALYFLLYFRGDKKLNSFSNTDRD